MSVSSYKVFMSFVDENGDSSRILSRECYEKWVETRKGTLKQPEESFRRVLTAHVCGLIGRKPFPIEVEANLLKVLRQREVWECFRGTDVSIGIKGFRKTGFHESRRGIFGSASLPSPVESIGQKRPFDFPDDFDTGIPPLKKHASEISPAGQGSQKLPDLTINWRSNSHMIQRTFPLSISSPTLYSSYLPSLQVPSTPTYSGLHVPNSPAAQTPKGVLSWSLV